ncbi:MAG: hypothetical protein KAJ51_01495, partial [Thermoplasmata archaeon]|nr:hypothetical protein [Thermoplasmata archaeon]
EALNLSGVELGEIWLDGYKINIDAFTVTDLINIQITTDYGFIKLSFENIHNIKTRNLVVNEEFSISGIIEYGAHIDFGIDLEDHNGAPGRQSISASGVLLDKWEFTIYTSELNNNFKVATDLKVPFVFYDNELETLSSLAVNIPLDFDEFNFTFEIMFNPSITTDDLSNTLTEISDNLNSALVTYDNWNARNFELLINNITDQLEIELADLKDEHGDLSVGFSIGVDRNSFFNAPLKIIIIETESSNDFQYLTNILNWIDYNSLELISILGHSSMPLIELSNLMTNLDGSQDDFSNIGFILLVGLAKASTKFEFIENVVDNNDDNNLNDGWFYIYTNLNNMRALMTSELGSPSLVAGYIDQPLTSSTIEPYPGILLKQDLPQMHPIITITVKKV